MTPTLIPVPFHGDTITCIETPEGVMVAITPICKRLGLASNKQISRLKADETRWGGYRMVSPSGGGEQETYCIPITKLAAWLFSITANRVKPELRDGLIRYQSEAADVLDRHFRQRAAETSARIEELERHVWHCHQQLRIDNQKWARAYLMMERGSSDYAIAQRNNWTMTQWLEEKDAMRDCAMIPTWRSDMQTLRSQNEELRWRADLQKRQAKQKDLFEATNVQ